jgi:hypothetical protein
VAEVPQVTALPVATEISASTSEVPDDARQVAARLKLHLGSAGGFVAVAGIAPDDRSDGLAYQLATALSQLGPGPVLLLDEGDAQSPGLVDVLRGGVDIAEAVRPRSGTDFYTLHYGTTPTTTLASVLSSARGVSELEMLRGRFPFVIANVGTVLAHPDYLLLTSRTDGVVAAVSAGRRRRHEIKYFHEQLQRLAVRLLGVVLTSDRSRR